MIRKKSGFTLPELMITMLMSGLILAAAGSAFIGLIKQSSTQGKIAESNESMIGLDLLRRDIESAGYGLAWDGVFGYSESAANPFVLNDAPTGAPRAIVSQDDVTAGFIGSDYLVIRAVNVLRNEACEKWTYVRLSNVARVWTPNSENLENNDRVIVLNPRGRDTRTLITSATGAFYTTYNSGTTSLADTDFAPVDENDTYTVYGMNSFGVLPPVRPFNRADYYLALPAAPDTLPSRCAPNTGILYKATMNHDAGGTLNMHPLIDCVADLQVIFGLDTDGDGVLNSYSNNISALTAQEIRTRVKEVRIYILTHEGGRDNDYIHPTVTMTVGEFGLGRDVNLGTDVNYRWKVFRMTVKPFNLN